MVEAILIQIKTPDRNSIPFYDFNNRSSYALLSNQNSAYYHVIHEINSIGQQSYNKPRRQLRSQWTHNRVQVSVPILKVYFL